MNDGRETRPIPDGPVPRDQSFPGWSGATILELRR
jgi:hypothetical protein